MSQFVRMKKTELERSVFSSTGIGALVVRSTLLVRFFG